MKVYSSDGSVLMEVKSLDHNGSNLEFTGTVMGAMPVKGALSPEEVSHTVLTHDSSTPAVRTSSF